MHLTKSTKVSIVIAVTSELLTTTAAARLIGVSPTSLKRWAQAGLVECVKTVGGHRRFTRSALRSLPISAQLGAAGSASGESPAEPADGRAGLSGDLVPERSVGAPGPRLATRPELDDEARPEAEPRETAELDQAAANLLHQLVESSDVEDVVRRLERERRELGSWWRVASRLGDVLVGLGALWRAGELTVVEEHLASERLQRALARCADGAPVDRAAPVALLVAASGEEHTLGLGLVELCLRAEGWSTRWVGTRAPFGAVKQYLAAHRIDVVALSASEGSVDAASLADEAERYAELCEPLDTALWLGGRGRWPEAPRHGVRLHELTELRAEVERRGRAHAR
jgi:excisionase family DNA binding protein